MPIGYRRAVVPVDFSPSSARTIREAVRLVADGGEIVLLHVARKLEPTLPWSATNRTVVAGLAREARAAARAGLAELAEKIRGPRVRTRVTEGVAHEKILAAARSARADAIVIGTQGHTVSERLLLGSTAERVIRKAGIPVVAVPPRRRR